MNAHEDSQAIATPAQYRLALLEAREHMTDTQLAMLRLQSAAPEHTITAEQLAVALQLAYPSTAANQYASFAKRVATALGYEPECQTNGTPRWWRALSYGRADQPETKDGSYQWVMRPELLETLRAMRWVP